MRNHNLMPRWAQASLGVSLMGFALIAGGISLAVNVHYGLQRTLAHAVAFGLADAVKIALPITARGLGGWDLCRRALWLGAILFSIWTAIAFFAETDSAKIARAQDADETRQHIGLTLTRIRADLSRITEADSAAALESLAKIEDQTAAREALTGEGPRHAEAVKAAARYRSRAAQARRRDDLTAKLAENEARLAELEPVPLGIADHLAALLGRDRKDIARTDSLVRTFATILFLEAIAALSGYGAALLGPLIAGRAPARRKADSAPGQPVQMGQEPAAAQKLRILLEASSDLEISRTQRDLAGLLKLPRSTLNGYLQRWRDAGWISVETRNGITRIKLLRAA